MSGYKDFISINIIGLDEAVSRLNALPATDDGEADQDVAGVERDL